MKKDYSNTKLIDLSYPLIGLSPMDGVSDSAYRQILRKYSTLANDGVVSPPLLITEFTHVMGLCYAGENVLHHFRYTESERPLIAQIYGAEPEYFYHASKIVCALGFDGLDINMGCPAQTVASSGAGAGLIRTPEVAKAIIEECKRGIADWVADGIVTGMKPKAYKYLMGMISEYKQRLENLKSEIQNLSIGQINLLGEKRIPLTISVKTRIGYDEIITEKWIKHISDQKVEWITVHGRTLKQGYGGQANWDEIKKAVEISEPPVLANGDVKVFEDLQRILDYTGAFGVLAGRATYGNPLFFANPDSHSKYYDLKKFMIEHAELFIKNKPDERAFVQLRKNFAWYCQVESLRITNDQNLNKEEKDLAFANLKQLRIKLVRVSNLEELKNALV